MRNFQPQKGENSVATETLSRIIFATFLRLFAAKFAGDPNPVIQFLRVFRSILTSPP